MTTSPFSLGRYEANIVSAGTFVLDGGAMFGVIPRALWEKQHKPNAQNGIRLATNLLLLRDGKRTILTDTGMGQKWSERHTTIFGIEAGPLEKNLESLGVRASDITDLFLTHLHFDHAGGATYRNDAGTLLPTFENARVHVGKRNWEWAHAPTERDRGSYRRENWQPFEEERDRLVLHDDSERARTKIFDEFEVLACEGHTTGQLLPLVGAKDQRALYGADMLPTRAHVRIAWHMGYDLRPIDVMKEKRALLSMCVKENLSLIFEHDPDVSQAKIEAHENDFRVRGSAP